MVDDTLVETGNWDILVDEFPLATPRALMRILDEEEDERGQKWKRGPSTSGEPPTKRDGPQGPPPPPPPPPSGGGQGITV